jgi:leader peptidase (prepilin peptidase) / N-methyltransferase
MLDNLERFSTSVAAFVFVVVLGLLWGSFANVCIYRWPPSEEFPNGRSVVKPGSHCFACKQPIKWYDNVPLLAWLWLRGKCRSCKAAFSSRYLIVEAVTGVLFGLAWWFTVTHSMWWWSEPFATKLIRFGIHAAFCVVMVVITFIDLDHKLILNKVTIPSIIGFYGFGLLLPERSWYDGLIGAAVGYGIPWIIGELYLRLRKIEGLGLGDSMLLAVVGALLGWKGVFISLFGGATIGVIIVLVVIVPRQLLAKKSSSDDDPQGESGEEAPGLMRTELPFGPFLAMGALFYLFAEPHLVLNFRLLAG